MGQRDLRNKFEGLDPARRDSLVSGGTFLGVVFDGGKKVTANGDYYNLVNPVEIGAQEEGQTPAFATDGSQAIPVAVIGQQPNVGDMIVCEYDGQRWFSLLSASTTTGVGITCCQECPQCGGFKSCGGTLTDVLATYPLSPNADGGWVTPPSTFIGTMIRHNFMAGLPDSCDILTGAVSYYYRVVCDGDHILVYQYTGVVVCNSLCQPDGGPPAPWIPYFQWEGRIWPFYTPGPKTATIDDCGGTAIVGHVTIPPLHIICVGPPSVHRDLDNPSGRVDFSLIKETTKKQQCCDPCPLPETSLTASLKSMFGDCHPDKCDFVDITIALSYDPDTQSSYGVDGTRYINTNLGGTIVGYHSYSVRVTCGLEVAVNRISFDKDGNPLDGGNRVISWSLVTGQVIWEFTPMAIRTSAICEPLHLSLQLVSFPPSPDRWVIIDG